MEPMTVSSTKQIPESAPEFAHIKRYWDPADECIVARVQQGEYYLTKEKEVISTVLGSCVSACVRDPVAGVVRAVPELVAQAKVECQIAADIPVILGKEIVPGLPRIQL